MINFDNIPKEKPAGFSLPTPGFHKATIVKETLKTSNNGNQYLELQLKLDSGSMVFDKIMDSDAPALQWKLGRLVMACKLPLAGELTLSDLGKVIHNKRLVIDVKHTENEWNGKTTTKAEVEIFANDIFYPIEEYEMLVGDAAATGEEVPPPTDTVY